MGVFTCYLMASKNSAVATGLEKVSFHSTSKERQCQRMLKLPHSCTHLTRQQSKARLQQYLNRELADVQEKAAEPEIKLPTFVGSWKKQENSRKISTSASLTLLKPLTVWITTNCGKFLKSREYQTTLPAS